MWKCSLLWLCGHIFQSATWARGHGPSPLSPMRVGEPLPAEMVQKFGERCVAQAEHRWVGVKPHPTGEWLFKCMFHTCEGIWFSPLVHPGPHSSCWIEIALDIGCFTQTTCGLLEMTSFYIIGQAVVVWALPCPTTEGLLSSWACHEPLQDLTEKKIERESILNNCWKWVMPSS
jgi:hypothetical protein